MSAEEKTTIDNDLDAIAAALEQVVSLPLEEQPAAFGRIRDQLEAELNNPSASRAGNSSLSGSGHGGVSASNSSSVAN